MEMDGKEVSSFAGSGQRLHSMTCWSTAFTSPHRGKRALHWAAAAIVQTAAMFHRCASRYFEGRGIDQCASADWAGVSDTKISNLSDRVRGIAIVLRGKHALDCLQTQAIQPQDIKATCWCLAHRKFRHARSVVRTAWTQKHPAFVLKQQTVQDKDSVVCAYP
eukprot:1709991-Amphidinium_carterae.1